MFGKLFGKKKETEVKASEAPQLNIEDLKKIASSISEEDKNKIIELVAAGRKIEAIKALRDATGVGLKEAMDIIEDYKTYFG